MTWGFVSQTGLSVLAVEVASVNGGSDSRGDGVGNDTGVADNEGPIDKFVNGDMDGEKCFELGAML